MNHKRKKPKSGRAGCLMCKPNKRQGVNDEEVIGHTGFGKLRKLRAAKKDMSDWKGE